MFSLNAKWKYLTAFFTIILLTGLLTLNVFQAFALSKVHGLSIASPEEPVIEVDPEKVTVHRAGDTFEIKIVVKNLASQLNVIGIQFSLVYDTSIMEFIGYLNGTFLNGFVNEGEQGVLYTEKHDFLGSPDLPADHNKIVFVAMILPDDKGNWHAPYPEGSGEICRLIFKVKVNPPASGTLSLTDTIILSKDLTEISHQTKDGYLEVRALIPAKFTVSDLSISPSEVIVGEEVKITVKVENVGEMEGTYTLTLKINEAVEATKDVTLDAGASTIVTFTIKKDKAGTYDVEIDGLKGKLIVKEAPPTLMMWLPYIILAVVIIVIIVFFILKRRAG